MSTTTTTYRVRLPDGHFLGRLSTGSTLVPVPMRFAYIWEANEISQAQMFAEHFHGEIV